MKKSLKKKETFLKMMELSIISGYCAFSCDGEKYLVSEDEHFWGYSSLIKDNFNIIIIKEWECNKYY